MSLNFVLVVNDLVIKFQDVCYSEYCQGIRVDDGKNLVTERIEEVTREIGKAILTQVDDTVLMLIFQELDQLTLTYLALFSHFCVCETLAQRVLPSLRVNLKHWIVLYKVYNLVFVCLSTVKLDVRAGLFIYSTGLDPCHHDGV